MEGEPGEIAKLLALQAGDITILKPRHSAFFASPLELLLTEMEARELVVCAESDAAKEAALAYMAGVLKCDVRPSTAPEPKPKRRGRRDL